MHELLLLLAAATALFVMLWLLLLVSYCATGYAMVAAMLLVA
jgi:hypothetical protein